MATTLISALLSIRLECEELIQRIAEGINTLPLVGDNAIVIGVDLTHGEPKLLFFAEGMFKRLGCFTVGHGAIALLNEEGNTLGKYEAEADHIYIAIPMADVREAYTLEIEL